MKHFISSCAVMALCAASLSASPPSASRQSEGRRNLRSELASLRHTQSFSLKGLHRASLPGSVARVLTPQAPSPAPQNGPKEGLYGWLTYSDSDDADSLYGLDYLAADGSISSVMTSTDMAFTGLWLRRGKWCSYAPTVDIDGALLDNRYVEYDARTGELSVTHLPLLPEKVFILSCYDPTSDTVYGYTYDPSGAGIRFSRASCSSPAEVEKVADADLSENLRALCFNTAKGVLAGFNVDGELVEVDPATGRQTIIGDVEVPMFYISGMAYDAASDSYIYNAQPREANSYLFTIDASTLEAEKVCTYPTGDSFIGLWCVGEAFYVNKSAPVAVTDLQALFPKGSLSGSVTFTAPALTMGGSPVLGNVDWVLSIDGREIRRGGAPAGSVVEVKGLQLEEGMHQFSLTCSLGQSESDPVRVSAYVGFDTPKAPAGVTLSADYISWQPVTEGAHGGYVDPAEVTYTVWLGDEVIADGTKSTSVPSDIPAGAPLQVYEASVMATSHGKNSETATSNDLTYGDGLALPVSLAPSDSEVSLFTTLDANGDGKSFKWSSTQAYFGGRIYAFYCPFNGKAEADDWLWLPGVILNDPDKVYDFSMNAFKANKYAERYEVKIGTSPTPEAMTQTLIAPTLIEAGAVDPTAWPPTPATASFLVPSAGIYYIGIHCISDADQYGLYVNDFHISSSDFAPQAPRAVTDLTATAAPEGALKADVSFTLPAVDILGTAYPEGKELMAYVMVEGIEDEVPVKGAPGARVSAEVATLQGDNEITVFVKDAALEGPQTVTKVFTGLDVPYIVSDFNIGTSEDNMDIILSWKAPTVGENGGYVAPSGNVYYLAQVVDGAWKVLGSVGTDVYTYTLSLPEGAPQDLYTFGILAGNEAGNSGSLTGQSVEAGTPYSLPMREDFSDGDIENTPLANYSGGQYTLKWGIGDAGVIDEYLANDGRIAFIGYSNTVGTAQRGRASLPRFSTRGIMKPSLVMTILGECCTSVDVYASAPGVETTLVQTVDISSLDHAVQEVAVSLPDTFADCGWVQIDLLPTVNVFTSYADAFVLYAYTVKNSEPYDFGVSSISKPETVAYGVPATFTACVENEGTEARPFPGGAWTMSDAEGNVISSVTIPAGETPVAPGDITEVPLAFTPSADRGGSLQLTFTLAAGDDSGVNDTRTVAFEVEKGDIPVITDLRAADVSYDAIVLRWSPLEGAAGRDVTGFDIYRDGVLIAADTPCPDNTYTDAGLKENSDYTYIVVPVQANGTKGLNSNTLHVSTTGLDGVSADDDSDCEYFSTGGVRIPRPSVPGIYMRRKGGKTEKIIVKR